MKNLFGTLILIVAICFGGIQHANAQFGAECVDGRNVITGELCVNSIITAIPFYVLCLMHVLAQWVMLD